MTTYNYWTVDDDIVWSVVAKHAPELREALSDEIETARTVLDTDDSDLRACCSLHAIAA
jgi:hypothetical protein